MERQVLPDGVHYESSLSYHRLVTELFLSSAVLCRQHGIELPGAFHTRLERMCDFVQGYTKPNGLAPQIGDGDNGRLHILTGYGRVDVRDHRHLLAVGGLFYDRADWLAVAGPSWVEGLWFGGVRHRARMGRQQMGRRCPGAWRFRMADFISCASSKIMCLFNCNPPGRVEWEPINITICSRWTCSSAGKIFLWIRAVFSILPIRRPIIDFVAPATIRRSG